MCTSSDAPCERLVRNTSLVKCSNVAHLPLNTEFLKFVVQVFR
jgi:hypothetical protein